MPSGNFHYYLCAKLNAEANSRTQKLHCYVIKFRFTSLYGNWQLDRSRFAPNWSRVPGYIYENLDCVSQKYHFEKHQLLQTVQTN